MLTIATRSLACLCLSKGYKRALLIRLSNSTEILFRKPFISRFLYCFAYIFFAYLNCSYVLAITGYNWLNLFRGLMKVCRTKNSNDPKPGVRVSSLWLWYYHWKLIFLRESCFTFIISLVIKKVWKSIECKIGLIQSSFWEWKENLISRYVGGRLLHYIFDYPETSRNLREGFRIFLLIKHPSDFQTFLRHCIDTYKLQNSAYQRPHTQPCTRHFVFISQENSELILLIYLLHFAWSSK